MTIHAGEVLRFEGYDPTSQVGGAPDYYVLAVCLESTLGDGKVLCTVIDSNCHVAGVARVFNLQMWYRVKRVH